MRVVREGRIERHHERLVGRGAVVVPKELTGLLSEAWHDRRMGQARRNRSAAPVLGSGGVIDTVSWRSDDPSVTNEAIWRHVQGRRNHE